MVTGHSAFSIACRADAIALAAGRAPLIVTRAAAAPDWPPGSRPSKSPLPSARVSYGITGACGPPAGSARSSATRRRSLRTCRFRTSPTRPGHQRGLRTRARNARSLQRDFVFDSGRSTSASSERPPPAWRHAAAVGAEAMVAVTTSKESDAVGGEGDRGARWSPASRELADAARARRLQLVRVPRTRRRRPGADLGDAGRAAGARCATTVPIRRRRCRAVRSPHAAVEPAVSANGLDARPIASTRVVRGGVGLAWPVQGARDAVSHGSPPLR
jgi:hypothetical protein